MAGRHPSYWTAAVTRRHEEHRAAHHVERQKFSYYLPETLAANTRGEFVKTELLFPGYIFIRVRRGWQSLASTRGIARLFMCGEMPVRMPRGDIEFLRSLEDANGFVRIGQRPELGDLVRVTKSGGAFADLIGEVVVASERRCEVLLALIGRSVRKVFDPRAVEVIGHGAAQVV